MQCETIKYDFPDSYFNLVEYKIDIQSGVSAVTCHLTFIFYILKVRLSKWSLWHAIHSCNRDRKLTVTAQRHEHCPPTLQYVDCS
jgi:hypothetical protein